MLPAILLGLVQGLTEFLPISSSGHLALAGHFLGLDAQAPDLLALTVVAHLGTLVAVLWLYWRDLGRIFLALGQGFFSPTKLLQGDARLGLLVLISTVPTAFIGLIWGDTFAAQLSHPLAVVGQLAITGLVLWLARGSDKKKTVDQISILDALLIGTAQGLAIAPGISRSGATIVMALWLGLSRDLAPRFSFLLSIPAISGAALLLVSSGVTSTVSASALLAAGVVALLTGYLSIQVLLALLRRASLRPFSLYLWGLSALALILLARG